MVEGHSQVVTPPLWVACLYRGQAPTWCQQTPLVREMQGHSCGWKLSMVPTVFATGKGIWKKFYQILLRSQCSWLKPSAVEVGDMTCLIWSRRSWSVNVSTCGCLNISTCDHLSSSCEGLYISTCKNCNIWICEYFNMSTCECLNVRMCKYLNTSMSKCLNISTC